MNTNVLGGSEARNHGIYDVFLPLVAKTRYLRLFLASTEQKHWYLRMFHHITKCGYLIRKEQKYCKLQCFESALRVRGRRGGEGVIK